MSVREIEMVDFNSLCWAAVFKLQALMDKGVEECD